MKHEFKCPRCNKLVNEYPALSRRADINICSKCGTEEAIWDHRLWQAKKQLKQIEREYKVECAWLKKLKSKEIKNA